MFLTRTIRHKDTLLEGVWHKSQLVPHQYPHWPSISLPKERDLHHPKPFTEVCKLHSRQRLGKDICNLLICGDILELHFSLLIYVSNIVIYDLDMFGPVMEHKVL